MSLDTILASGELKEVVVELDSAKRSDGTLKTWYYSVFFRETGSTDTPANTTMPQYLVSVGPLSQGLSEDMLFAGLAASDPGSIVIVQPTPAVDQISQLIDYTFQGYECRVKIGLVSSLLYTDFVRYRTAIIESEPDIVLTSAGIQATVKLLSMTRRLEEEALIVNHYVGIPHCARFSTATASAVVPRIAAYDLVRFTGMIRFRCTANPSATITLHSKVVSSTNNNWQLVLSTSGTVQLFGSGGGVADLQILSGNMCDGTWKTVVFARDTNLTAYLMINNVVIGTDTALSGSPNAAVANLILNFRSSGTQAIDIQDARLYDRYIPPDEARGLSSIRSDGDDLGCIGLWRFDDNTSNKGNDYSANNNDTNAFGGTVNVDYSWQASDLGEPELAGRAYPIVIGEVFNATAQLIDGSRSRFRINDGPTPEIADSGIAALTVRSQGTVVTGDYTLPTGSADGVMVTSTGASDDEPVTYDHLFTGALNQQKLYVSKVFEKMLTGRTRLTSSNIDTLQVDALTVLCPWLAGYYSNQDTNAQVAAQEILGNSGLCYYDDENGKIVPDFWIPPYGYGPYGEPVLDFRGKAGNYVEFTDINAPSSFTIACWFKSSQLDQTAFNMSGGFFYLVSKGVAPANYALYFTSTGTNAGRFGFSEGVNEVVSPAKLIKPDTWYFVAGVSNLTTFTSNIFLAEYGTSLVSVASGVAGVPLSDGNPLRIGGFSNTYSWGSIQHAQLWTVAKTQSELQALMTTPPIGNESNLPFYASLNEGTGNPTNKVTGVAGTVNGTVQWAPKLVINLNDTPSVRLIEFHHIKPVYDILVQFARNRTLMDDSNIDLAITGDDRIELKREWKKAPYTNPTTQSRFKGARRIRLDSSLTDRESAQHLLRALVTRFGTDRYIGVLEFPAGLNISAQACGLKLMDEIGITAAVPSQLSALRSFRVVNVAHNPIKLSTNVTFCG